MRSAERSPEAWIAFLEKQILSRRMALSHECKALYMARGAKQVLMECSTRNHSRGQLQKMLLFPFGGVEA